MLLLMLSLGMQAQTKFHDVEANGATGSVKCIKSRDYTINFSKDGKMEREGFKDAKYDANGYLISVTLSSRDNDIPIKYTWENGKIKTESMSMMGKDMVTTFTYNEKGALASRKTNLAETTFTDYKYDTKGNWISRKIRIVGKEIEQEQTRTIEYYGETSKEETKDASQNKSNRSSYSEIPYEGPVFELYYPDGTVVKYPYYHMENWKKQRYDYIVINDTICVYALCRPNKKWFQNALNQDHFSFSPESLNGYRIYSPYYRFESFSEKDVANFFKDKVLPYVRSEERNSVFYLTKNLGDYYEYVAKYDNREETTKATQEARNKKIHEDLDKGYSNYISRLKKKYGVKYVDAAIKGKLLVGMPLDLLLEQDFWLYWDRLTVNVKGHYMAEYSWDAYHYNQALGIYKAERREKDTSVNQYIRSDYFIIWVRNGKITQINK